MPARPGRRPARSTAVRDPVRARNVRAGRSASGNHRPGDPALRDHNPARSSGEQPDPDRARSSREQTLRDHSDHRSSGEQPLRDPAVRDHPDHHSSGEQPLRGPACARSSFPAAPYAAFPTAPGAPVIATPLEASPASRGPATADSAPYVVFTTPPGTVFPSFTPPPPPPSKFVFAVLPGLTFGISARMIPSTNVSLFFGGRLRGGKWALGYQFTGSVGMAERYFLGIATHRHHITALTNFGRRGFATVGAGVAFFILWPNVVELETRVGVRFGARKRGVVGGQIRLGHNFYYHEKAPLPQFGLFIGLSLL